MPMIGELSVPARTIRLSKDDALNRLRKIGELQADWNGNGATGFSAELVRCAEHLIMMLPLVPLPVPSTRGGVALQFEDERLGYLDFLMFEDGHAEMYAASPSGTQDMSACVKVDEIPEKVQAFSQGEIWTAA